MLEPLELREQVKERAWLAVQLYRRWAGIKGMRFGSEGYALPPGTPYNFAHYPVLTFIIDFGGVVMVIKKQDDLSFSTG